MGLIEEFHDRQIQEVADSEEYHPYEYQTDNNSSWAGALPVKQYVLQKSPAQLYQKVPVYMDFRC